MPTGEALRLVEQQVSRRDAASRGLTYGSKVLFNCLKFLGKKCKNKPHLLLFCVNENSIEERTIRCHLPELVTYWKRRLGLGTLTAKLRNKSSIARQSGFIMPKGT